MNVKESSNKNLSEKSEMNVIPPVEHSNMSNRSSTAQCTTSTNEQQMNVLSTPQNVIQTSNLNIDEDNTDHGNKEHESSYVDVCGASNEGRSDQVINQSETVSQNNSSVRIDRDFLGSSCQIVSDNKINEDHQPTDMTTHNYSSLQGTIRTPADADNVGAQGSESNQHNHLTKSRKRGKRNRGGVKNRRQIKVVGDDVANYTASVYVGDPYSSVPPSNDNSHYSGTSHMYPYHNNVYHQQQPMIYGDGRIYPNTQYPPQQFDANYDFNGMSCMNHTYSSATPYQVHNIHGTMDHMHPPPPPVFPSDMNHRGGSHMYNYGYHSTHESGPNFFSDSSQHFTSAQLHVPSTPGIRYNVNNNVQPPLPPCPPPPLPPDTLATDSRTQRTAVSASDILDSLITPSSQRDTTVTHSATSVSCDVKRSSQGITPSHASSISNESGANCDIDVTENVSSVVSPERFKQSQKAENVSLGNRQVLHREHYRSSVSPKVQSNSAHANNNEFEQSGPILSFKAQKELGLVAGNACGLENDSVEPATDSECISSFLASELSSIQSSLYIQEDLDNKSVDTVDMVVRDGDTESIANLKASPASREQLPNPLIIEPSSLRTDVTSIDNGDVETSDDLDDFVIVSNSLKEDHKKHPAQQSASSFDTLLYHDLDDFVVQSKRSDELAKNDPNDSGNASLVIAHSRSHLFNQKHTQLQAEARRENSMLRWNSADHTQGNKPNDFFLGSTGAVDENFMDQFGGLNIQSDYNNGERTRPQLWHSHSDGRTFQGRERSARSTQPMNGWSAVQWRSLSVEFSSNDLEPLANMQSHTELQK